MTAKANEGIGQNRDRQPDTSPKAIGVDRGIGARLGRAVRAGADQVAENPFAAVAGAAAVSAGLALLLPSSRREAKVMGDVADTLAGVAREAADTVVAAGQSQVEALAQTAIASAAGAAVEAMVSGQGAVEGGR
jgi:hypothetical protein